MSFMVTFSDMHIINFDYIHLSYLSGAAWEILFIYPMI